MSKMTLLPLVLLLGCSEHGKTPEPFGVPITGGTMTVSRDGTRAVISDPDRDRILQVDLASEQVISETPLDVGDEPGRVVEDAAGRMHVALRRGGALATLDTAGAIVERRSVCPEPRGLAYDTTTDLVHVACSGGELVTFRAAGGAPTRSLRLERDLRDVVVNGANLIVTRFRNAEMLTIDPTGAIVGRVLPPTVPRFDFGGPTDLGPDTGSGGAPGGGSFEAPASTAWRTIAMPDGRLVMSHQRRVKNVLDTETPGGYGGSCGGGPLEDAVTVVTPGQTPQAVARIGRGALPVDIAASRSGDKIAVAVAGSREVIVVSSIALSSPDEDTCEPPNPTPCGDFPGGDDGGSGMTGGGSGGTAPPSSEPDPKMGECCEDKDRDGSCDDDDDEDEDGDSERLGPPTSLGWTPSGDLVIFYPEAPALIVRTQGTGLSHRIDLPGGARNDAGRNVFHRQTAIGVSCASCHPEGRDDGMVWNFASLGVRRTQSLAGNILDRAPYHWAGDEASLPVLLDDVFAKRMSGGILNDRQKNALGPWLNRIPAPAPTVADPAAAARGAAIFEAPAVGCVSCHNGALLTNNLMFNVGTGGTFKVPSLLGVGDRAPFLHNGCAQTLMDRFINCSGGPGAHGDTSKLSADQLKDLVAYLESL
ncbi:MAG: cytochrome-c peroxidase [Deltaproteobacteria bacterium]|nr:cytochrome-c peroxidase [Deltaproteobacteria bacterium]